MSRETTKRYEENGRTFILSSYDPMEGNYILTQLLAFALPLGLGEVIKSQLNLGSEGESALPNFGTQRPMAKEDFMQLQKDILKTISEELSGGNTTPVLRDNGTYGITDITLGLTLRLLGASIAFNFKDFFGELPSLENFTKQ